MKIKKFIPLNVLAALVLLLSLIFSTPVFATGNNGSDIPDVFSEQGKELLIKERQKTANDLKEKLGYDGTDNDQRKAYQPDEEVRIIVEVDQPKKLQTMDQHEQKEQMKQIQDDVINDIQKTQKARTKDALRHRFFEGLNGFSMETEFKQIKQIKKQSNVKEVHIAKTFKPSLNTSKELVQAQETWEEYGLKGEGLLVAVVDTGLDYTHKDMTLSEKGKEEKKWSESSIQPVLDETDADDKWYTDKVPSGYDWADMDNEVIPEKNAHGMHVAGIIGANGDEEDGGVTGLAPDVQLLAEKVFSDENNIAYEDDIIAGMEHAVELDADVINLSLGTDAGFVGEEDDPVQKTIRQATENGTLVIAAAGNAYYSTKNSLMETAQKPYASNPDIGVVSAPGVSPFALSVASYENSDIHYESLNLSDDSKLLYADQTQFGFKLHNSLDADTSYELVYGGEGRDS
ncbi:MAG TPA: S8 family serine peptidase, partial [Bacillota bacterium]|nr:S8 family serine peptidase [Bacillota bacterium]